MINWTPIVTFPFNVWKQTTPVELCNRKIGEIVVGASHWQLCIVLLDSGIMGMIGKLLLELEYCPRNNRANAKAKPLRTFFTGLMLRISKSFKSKILSLSSIYFKQLKKFSNIDPENWCHMGIQFYCTISLDTLTLPQIINHIWVKNSTA